MKTLEPLCVSYSFYFLCPIIYNVRNSTAWQCMYWKMCALFFSFNDKNDELNSHCHCFFLGIWTGSGGGCGRKNAKKCNPRANT
jgi:hypothetical protein